MEKQKANILPKSIVLLLFALLSGLCIWQVAAPVRSADASVAEIAAIDDDFNRLPPRAYWLKNDFTFAAGESTLSLHPSRDYGYTLIFKGYRVHGDCEIAFTASASGQGVAAGDWFGVQFGHNDPRNRTWLANAMIGNQYAAVFMMDDEGGKQNFLTDESIRLNNKDYATQSYVQHMLTDKVRVVYSLKKTGVRELDGKNMYTVSCYYYKEDEERPSQPQYFWDNIAADGYFGFAMLADYTFRFYDLSVYENGALVAKDDMQEGTDRSVSFGVPSADCRWVANGFSKSAVYYMTDGSIKAENKNDGMLLSAHAILSDALCDKQFTLSYDLHINALPEGTVFGTGFALTPVSVAADAHNLIGIVGTAERGFYRAVLVIGGKTVQTSEPFPASDDIHVTFTGHHDGRVVFTANDFVETFYAISFDGNFALGVTGEDACTLTVDNVRLTENAYRDIGRIPYAAIDFTGTKTDEIDGETYITKYVDSGKWFMGQNVTVPRYTDSDSRDYVYFGNSNDRSGFGTYRRYAEFVCRFSVTVTTPKSDTADNTAIGLTFGKNSLLADDSDTRGIYFYKSAFGMALRAENCTFAGGGSVVPQYMQYPDLDFWQSEDCENSAVTYRVTVIVCGGKADIYYARADAPKEEHSVLRATVENADCYGYVTVQGKNGATFRLNDYAIESIAIDRSEPLLTASSKSDGAMYTDFLLQSRVSVPTGGAVTVSFGSGDTVTLGNGTVISSMRALSSSAFNADILRDGIIVVRATGNRIAVGIAAFDGPQSRLFESIAVFERENSASGTVTVSSLDAQMQIGYMQVASLDGQIVCNSGDFSDADANMPTKPTVSSTRESGGCKSSVSGTSALGAAVILSVACGVLKRRKAI